MQTRGEIEALKNNWRRDPCWDLEDTDGCEEYRAELLVYRKTCEAEWEKKREQRELTKADELGCSGNRALARYVLTLERRLERIETKIF